MSTTEIFNADTVKGTISDVEGQFGELSSIISEINGKVAEALGSPDRAMYGDAASRVLATWDENCSMLNEFMKIFDSWSSMVVSIANEYGNLQEGTAVVQAEDKQYFQDIANASRSTYLQTDAAKEAYQGSTSTYTDKDGIEHTITKNLTDGMVHTYKDSDGKEIIDYSTLAGTQIGSSIAGKLTQDDKEVKELLTEEQKETESKLEVAKKNIEDNATKRYEKAKKELEKASKEGAETTAKIGSDVEKATKQYADELETAAETYTGENTFMTITNKNVNGSNLRITHVVVNDPSQLVTIQANDSYGSGGESIYSMASRTENLVVAATGAFFQNNGSGRQNLIGDNNGVVSNGVLVDSVKGYTGGKEICIDKKGKIFYAPARVSWNSLINDYGVVNTYASHEAQRLDNGQILNYHSGMEWDKAYNRTYLCMKKPGEYYLIQGYSTPETAIRYAKDTLGCTFAGSLEQGGAVAEVTSNGTVQSHSGYSTISNAFAIVDI